MRHSLVLAVNLKEAGLVGAAQGDLSQPSCEQLALSKDHKAIARAHHPAVLHVRLLLRLQIHIQPAQGAGASGHPLLRRGMWKFLQTGWQTDADCSATYEPHSGHGLVSSESADSAGVVGMVDAMCSAITPGPWQPQPDSEKSHLQCS